MTSAKARTSANKDKKVAAVTMSYNEPDFLPIWVRHYSAQVGPRNCYVIDHGSDDGSTDNLGEVNVIRIPRSPYDEEKCARCITGLCASLLQWYDWFIYTDVDEIAVADPKRHASLSKYCASCKEDVITAIGFNILHTNDEAPIDPSAAILEQRKWVFFLASMCKPGLTRKPIVWNPGFHRADEVQPKFDDLYIFHLRYFDRDTSLRRLAKTRAQAWAFPDSSWWARVSDKECREIFSIYNQRPQNKTVKVSKTAPAVRKALAQTLGNPEASGEDTYNVNYEVSELWEIPERFRSIF